MSEISVIGLGPMGFVLAQKLLENGRSVTVWNRTEEKAEPLLHNGAQLAPDVSAAVAASPIVVVCVADYKVTQELLDTDKVTGIIAGKILLQLTTGSPQDARNGEHWAVNHGVAYVDGAIMATPNQMGRPDTTILVSGTQAAYERAEPVLKIFGGNILYQGEQVGAASALDFAILSVTFGAFLGFYHGARIMEAEKMRVDSFGDMIAAIAPVLGEMIQHDGQIIQTSQYENAQSSVKTVLTATDMLVRQAGEAGINAEFPKFLTEIFRRTSNAGFGDEQLAAVMKVLRQTGK